MKIRFLSIAALFLAAHSTCFSSQSQASYKFIPKIIDDITQLCGIDSNNNLTLLSPNYGSVSIAFMDENGIPLLANEFYRDYSIKSKLFIYKYNIKSYPKTIIINGLNIGECK
jgi:hypothetical protein